MKIKLKVGLAGSRFVYKPGDVIDVPAIEAEAHVRKGAAEFVDPPQPESTPKPIERAVSTQPKRENAVTPAATSRITRIK